MRYGGNEIGLDESGGRTVRKPSEWRRHKYWNLNDAWGLLFA